MDEFCVPVSKSESEGERNRRGREREIERERDDRSPPFALHLLLVRTYISRKRNSGAGARISSAAAHRA